MGSQIGNSVLAGHDTARVQQLDRTERDQKARTKAAREYRAALRKKQAER